MGYTGSHFPQGRKFVRLHQLSIKFIHPCIIGNQPINGHAGGQYCCQDNRYDTGEDNEYLHILSCKKVFHLIGYFLADNQKPFIVFEPASGIKREFSVLAVGDDHRRAAAEQGGLNHRFGKDFTIKAGQRLKYSF